jgi:predicted dehydrogenase
MDLGKHVYVQKPMCWSVHEARHLAKKALEKKVVTQMGNQGHSEEGLRLMQEWFDAGALGEVREVHCWTNRPIWPQGMPRPADEMPVPQGLDWDLWIGPSPTRPFHKTYHPFGWRAWQDFGAGAMGDMACHVMDASYTILEHHRLARLQLPAPGARPARLRPACRVQRQLPAVVGDPPDVPGTGQHARSEAALVRRRHSAGAAR